MDGLVSLIIAVLNAERFVVQALTSAAAQDYRPLEVLVIDGGSADGTAALVQAFAQRQGGDLIVRPLPQAGTGLAAAWNTGLAAATGEFVTFLDSDDVWLPGKLSAQVAYLRANPEAQYVLGQVRFFLEPGCSRPATMRPEIFTSDHLARMPGALLARRGLFAQIGEFDPGYGITTDMEWFARAAALGVPGGAVPDTVIRKRVHEANLAAVAGPERIMQHLPRLLKEALELRRKRATPTAD
ncbi:MAG: glycosyltransferase [Anaerolineales bacterium]|nr:glycosyltransferase [Anaerolineales bacterium]